MAVVQTVKVKADNTRGYKTINRSDFDPKRHKLAEGEKVEQGEAALNDEQRKVLDELNAKRQVEANRGITGGEGPDTLGRNPSGTFSEPTPTDIRYPNKDATEFENNHGAFVGKSAAQIRQEKGMEDEPGGLMPDKKRLEDQRAADARLAARKLRDGEPEVAEQQASNEDVDSMTVAELRDHAQQHNIDLDGATTKADILKKIKRA